jgi:hypothetical protein
MNRPPIWMNVRVKHDDSRHGFFIPLPLFLLLPLVFVILLVLSPLILIGVALAWPSGWGKVALKALGASFGLYCAARGLKLDIRGPQQIVKVSVV